MNDASDVGLLILRLVLGLTLAAHGLQQILRWRHGYRAPRAGSKASG